MGRPWSNRTFVPSRTSFITCTEKTPANLVSDMNRHSEPVVYLVNGSFVTSWMSSGMVISVQDLVLLHRKRLANGSQHHFVECSYFGCRRAWRRLRLLVLVAHFLELSAIRLPGARLRCLSFALLELRQPILWFSFGWALWWVVVLDVDFTARYCWK